MTDGTKNICMVRGDTLAFGIEIDGLEQDLDTVFFTCKANYDDTDANAVFKKSLGSGIEKVSDGQYRVRVAPEDTANVDPGMYYYDLELGVNSDIFTVLRGTLRINWDVTRNGV